MPSLNRKRVAALLNVAAGTIDGRGEAALRDILASAFEKHGISANLEFLPSADLRAAALLEGALRARNL